MAEVDEVTNSLASSGDSLFPSDSYPPLGQRTPPVRSPSQMASQRSSGPLGLYLPESSQESLSMRSDFSPDLGSYPTPAQKSPSHSNSTTDGASQSPYKTALKSQTHAANGKSMPAGTKSDENKMLNLGSPKSRKAQSVQPFKLHSLGKPDQKATAGTSDGTSRQAHGPSHTAGLSNGTSRSEPGTSGKSGSNSPPSAANPAMGPATGPKPAAATNVEAQGCWGNGQRSQNVRQNLSKGNELSARQKLRENTVKVKFLVNPTPTFSDKNFNTLIGQLDLDFSEIVRVMDAKSDGSVFVTCKSRQIADRLLRVPSRPFNGGHIKISSMEPARDFAFKAKYLPPFISDQPLRQALSEFGQISEIPGPTLPGLPGVFSDLHYSIRLKEDVSMNDLPVRVRVKDIDRPSDSYLTTLVFQDFQRCFKCERAGHHAGKCPEPNCTNCKGQESRRHTTLICGKYSPRPAAPVTQAAAVPQTAAAPPATHTAVAPPVAPSLQTPQTVPAPPAPHTAADNVQPTAPSETTNKESLQKPPDEPADKDLAGANAATVKPAPDGNENVTEMDTSSSKDPRKRMSSPSTESDLPEPEASKMSNSSKKAKTHPHDMPTKAYKKQNGAQTKLMKDILSQTFTLWCQKHKREIPQDSTERYLDLYQLFLDDCQSSGVILGSTTEKPPAQQRGNSRGRGIQRGGRGASPSRSRSNIGRKATSAAISKQVDKTLSKSTRSLSQN